MARITLPQYARRVEAELASLGTDGTLAVSERPMVEAHYKLNSPALSCAIILKGDRMAAARKAAGEAV